MKEYDAGPMERARATARAATEAMEALEEYDAHQASPSPPIMKQTAKQRAKGRPSTRPRDESAFMVVCTDDDGGSDELIMVMARPTDRNAVAKSDSHVNDE